MSTFFSKSTFSYVKHRCAHFLYILIEPRSADDDNRRHEFILNILLLGATILVAEATGSLIYNLINYWMPHDKSSLIVTSIIFVIFSVLYTLSRHGFFKWSAYIFTGTLFIASTYVIYTWGVKIPQGLLGYVLTIIIAGILISTRFAFFITILTSISLLGIAYLQKINVINPDLYWNTDPMRIDDVVVIVFTLIVIAVVSWLGNREIERSLRRARSSEEALRKERDSLEIKVKERTKQLVKTQEERSLNLYRFATLGRLSAGLLHDIANPLTAIILSAERLKKHPEAEHILRETERIRELIATSKRQINDQKENGFFAPEREIASSIETLTYRARAEGVEIVFHHPREEVRLYGNRTKFYRIMNNILSNALDSYLDIATKDKKVIVGLSRRKNSAHIEVHDHGCGVKAEHLDRIFEPMFTTKIPGEGTGLGLTVCKEIVEKDFDGTIKARSEWGDGCAIVVDIPIHSAPPHHIND